MKRIRKANKKITFDDIEKALQVLDKWRQAAKLKQKKEVILDIDHIERIIRGLLT